jgi:F-type H+-transporting ATPase subunit gamma
MPGLRDIRRRIRSVGNTAQITRAMQMVAASKMRKAQEATLSTRPFGQLLYRIQRHATAHLEQFTHPLLEVREIRKRAVILVGTDRGLCGALNSNLFRLAAQFDAQTAFIAVGKRAAQFVARSRRELLAEFTITDSPRFAEARPIASFARDLFLNGEVDQVQIVVTRFINTMVQQVVAVEFLPVGEIKGVRVPGDDSDGEPADDIPDILFEPSPGAVLSYLLGHYLNILLYRALLEAKASEQSARMVAMTNATDNATALIRDLTLEYNKLRQGNITKELLEIAGGQLGSN